MSTALHFLAFLPVLIPVRWIRETWYQLLIMSSPPDIDYGVELKEVLILNKLYKENFQGVAQNDSQSNPNHQQQVQGGCHLNFFEERKI